MEVYVIFFILQNIILHINGENGVFIGNDHGNLNLNETFFAELVNGQINATEVPENTYKWAARVVLTRKGISPFLCNAVCIQPRIFITAARCLVGISLYYARIIYQNIHLSTIAQIYATNHTKQYFDDIGFIVTRDIYPDINWQPISLYNGPNRTDSNFTWFTNLNILGVPKKHKLVSYAPTVFQGYNQNSKTKYALYDLNVIVGLKFCESIYSRTNKLKGYRYPCCLQCNLKEYSNYDAKCKTYLGVEGAVVFNTDTERLLGIVTWGYMFPKKILPVGFSVPNTINFWKNYECALLIKNHEVNDNIQLGYYQNLCALL